MLIIKGYTKEHTDTTYTREQKIEEMQFNKHGLDELTYSEMVEFINKASYSHGDIILCEKHIDDIKVINGLLFNIINNVSDDNDIEKVARLGEWVNNPRAWVNLRMF